MNVLKQFLLSTSMVWLSLSSSAFATNIYDQLKAQVDVACPVVWEDLAVSISETVPTGDVWQGDAADRSLWVSSFALANSMSEPDADLIAGVVAAVASECAAFRTALVDELIANTPADVTLALNSAANGGDAGSYLNGAWMVGDIRTTGRASSAPGWVFLTGQTVGSSSSAADLKGPDYLDLFELAKSWAPNSGSEDWTSGAVVTLPDMRGRAVVGADNLGGTPAGVVANAQADVVGGVYGIESTALSSEQLPTHNHTMNTMGSHTHGMNNDSHSHQVRTSSYAGHTSQIGGWNYFGVARPRPGYQFSFAANNAIVAASHKHTVVAAPGHQHTIDNKGSSADVTFTQPSITFNVEMKY
jgi:microcystin-dependent protein